ncbi:hypothetical protein [Chengkuizengella sediminis]|uniref:hypothetical protein n=1 Tax=Chengkuizengella sediminis TaxID=1885917 RepID=UPI00138A2444|nr:hypothetical protein [Chengkuizengella sediminis]
MGTMGLLAVHFLKNYYKVKQVDIVEPDIYRHKDALSFGVTNIFKPSEFIGNIYDFGIECSARNKAFGVLQKVIKHKGEICILSDGNKEEFILMPLTLHKRYF